MNVTEALKIALDRLDIDPKLLKSTLISRTDNAESEELLKSFLKEREDLLKKKGLSSEELLKKVNSEYQYPGWLFTFETKHRSRGFLRRIKVNKVTGEVTILETLANS